MLAENEAQNFHHLNAFTLSNYKQLRQNQLLVSCMFKKFKRICKHLSLKKNEIFFEINGNLEKIGIMRIELLKVVTLRRG